MGAVLEGVLDLADGRRLAYSEWGSRDDPAVVYCHGYPGSRREIRLSEPVIGRRGVKARVIAMNRPGYGPSTFKSGFGFLDWPRDVEEAADHLGIGRFGVIGASGGCPFALACGYSLGDRVARISIVVGAAPPEATGMLDGLGIAGIPKRAISRRFQYGLVSAASRVGLQSLITGRMQRAVAEADRRMLRRPEVRAWFADTVCEAFSNGGRAAAAEGRLYLEPWSFDVAEVTTETTLWYGAEDRNVPASAGRWLADRLPNSTYTEWPDQGHFTWAASDAAADVVAAAVADPHESSDGHR